MSYIYKYFQTRPSKLSTYIVETVRTGYLKGLEAYAGVTERLEDLKMSLGPEDVMKLEKRYKLAGGEQFLEDREGLKCRFPK